MPSCASCRPGRRSAFPGPPVAVARALWLLDEPYANLDLPGIELVNRMVQAQLRAGGAALVTTHGAYAAPPVRTRQLLLERPA